MERSLSRSLPYLPRYQSLSPARSPCLGGRRFASLRSVSSPSHSQRICYIDAGEPTKFVTTSYRGRGSSPSPKRAYKVHLFCPAFSSDGKKRVHHATRVTRSLSAHDLNSSHVYTSQDELLPGAARHADARRVCTSLQDLFHKGPFRPDATTASESGVSLGGLSDESLSLCGGDDLDNLSQHSFDSSSAFHEITFDSEYDRCDSSDAYFSGTEGSYSGFHHSGERLLDVLFEDDPDGKTSGERRKRVRQNISSPLSYGEHRRRELQFPCIGEHEHKVQAKLQALRVLIPGTDVSLKTSEATMGVKDHSKSPRRNEVLSSTPLAQSTPHVSPRSIGEAKLSILASWDADDSLEEHQYQASKKRGPVARLLFEADSSDLRDGSSCNSSQSEDNFSDISSATVGSLQGGRRVKLVKRPSDKPASSKTSTCLEDEHREVRNISPEQYDLNCQEEGEQIIGTKHNTAVDSKPKEGSLEDLSKARCNGSGDDEGDTSAISAASTTWQDRQAYHEGNARVTGALGNGRDEDDEGEDGDEEDGGNENQGKFCVGQNKKARGFNKIKRRSPSPISGVVRHTANLEAESAVKLNIPLINAGKHGQEKLRKRRSLTSPPLTSGEKDQDPVLPLSKREQDQDEQLLPNTVHWQGSKAREANGDRQNGKYGYKKENCGEETNDAVTVQDMGSRYITGSIIGDGLSGDLRTGESYDKYVGPGEVTEIPALTAGHPAHNAGQAQDEEAMVVIKTECGLQRGGRGEQPETGNKDLQERGEEEEKGGADKPTYSSEVCLPGGIEDGEREIKGNSQVLGSGGGVGERLRSRSTSPSLTNGTDSQSDRSSIWAAGHGTEQQRPDSGVDGVNKRATGKTPTTIGVTTESEIAEGCGDSTKLAHGVNANAPRTQSATTVQISPTGDTYKSELKLTLTVTVHDRVDKKRTPAAGNDNDSTDEQPSSSKLKPSQEILTGVQHERENETESESEELLCDAKNNADLHVIGEARSNMKRFPIDPPIVEGARAASEGETPQMLVRVVATAQNITGPETVQQARHKDQSQQLSLVTEFPSQRPPHVSKFSSSGFTDYSNSLHSCGSGATDSQLNTAFPSGGVELNTKTFRVNARSSAENNSKDSNFNVFCEHIDKPSSQSLNGNGNILGHANGQSIHERTSGCSAHDENKGEESVDSGSAHAALTEDGCRVVQKKQVVTEVCHTVVKKTHSTTVEDNKVSTERDTSRPDRQCFAVRNDSRDRTKDTSSKTTIVEDIEDTVTTKTTTTTTTLNLDSSGSDDSNKETRVENSHNYSEACKVGQYNDRDVTVQKEQSRISSPAGRDEYRPKCEDKQSEGQNLDLTQLSTCTTTGQGLAETASHQSGVPSDHVMREVKPDWEAQVDPRVTAWHSSSPSSPPSSSSHRDGGVNVYQLKRHGELNNTTGNRLDSLQATLAQISGLKERTEAWSCHRDAPRTKHTHGFTSSPTTSPFSPSYQDHAEATSVLKQIVRGDTDVFPNFSRPGKPATETNRGDDYDTLPEYRTQVHNTNSGPTYYSYSIQVREEPTRDYTPSAQVGNGDAKSEQEIYDNDYDNDYDNAPFVTTALPPRQQQHYHHNHHHHHLQLLKPGQLKASSLWTLQEETESLLDAVSPKPSRRTLTSLASDDEDNTDRIDQGTEKEEPTESNDNIRPNSEVGRSNISLSSAEQDLSDTAIGHKHFVSESSDFDDSDGNYSSISTGESASYRSSSYDREQTPMSDDTEVGAGKMEHRPSWKGLTASNIDGVSSFSDFVTGLEESLSSPCTEVINQRGNLKRRREQGDRMFTLENLSESLRQFTDQAETGQGLFPGRNSPVHIFHGGEREHQSFHSTDNDHSHFSQPSHLNKDSPNTSATSTSTLGHYSWISGQPEDHPSEASLRLHALDMDLSRISSCGSPAPSDLSDASSAYTCTGTAQVRRHQLHVSFDDGPMAGGLLSPPTHDRLPASLTTSTPKAKSIIKHQRPSLREDLSIRQKHADNLRQFDQILKDFHKRTNPVEAVNEIQIMDTQETNVLADMTSVANTSNYADLYKEFTNDDTEKLQNNTCIVVEEDENMSSYRFKRFLKKSHTKRRKGKKLMRFINRLSCVSESVSPDMSPANKKMKTDNQSKHNVQVYSTYSTPLSSTDAKLAFPDPQFTSSAFFQHHNQTEARLGVVSPSSSTPPQGSPASSTQSMDSGRSRADSAYSSISESLSQGSVSSPRHLLLSNRGSGSSSFCPSLRASTTADRSFSTDSAYSSSARTASDVDRTLVDDSKDESMDMLSALSDVFEQLDVCEGEIDKALLERMRYGHYRAARSARPARRM